MNKLYWKFCVIVACCVLGAILLGLVSTITIIVWKVNKFLAVITAILISDSILRSVLAIVRLFKSKKERPKELKSVEITLIEVDSAVNDNLPSHFSPASGNDQVYFQVTSGEFPKTSAIMQQMLLAEMSFVYLHNYDPATGKGEFSTVDTSAPIAGTVIKLERV